MVNQREIGAKAEQMFMEILKEKDIPYNYMNSSIDFEVLNQSVDVKSCLISQKFTNRHRNTQSYKIGRISLSNEQIKASGHLWIACFCRWDLGYLFLGLIRAREFNGSRYMTLHRLRKCNVLSMDEFIEKFNT